MTISVCSTLFSLNYKILYSVLRWRFIITSHIWIWRDFWFETLILIQKFLVTTNTWNTVGVDFILKMRLVNHCLNFRKFTLLKTTDLQHVETVYRHFSVFLLATPGQQIRGTCNRLEILEMYEGLHDRLVTSTCKTIDMVFELQSNWRKRLSGRI